MTDLINTFEEKVFQDALSEVQKHHGYVLEETARTLVQEYLRMWDANEKNNKRDKVQDIRRKAHDTVEYPHKHYAGYNQMIFTYLRLNR